MINLLAGFHVYKYACHLEVYLLRLHRKWWKLLRTQWLSAVILMQMRHKCCAGQGNVTSSCYVNFSSNLTGLQFIQMSEPDKNHLASFILLLFSTFFLPLSTPCKMLMSPRLLPFNIFFSVPVLLWALTLFLSTKVPHCFVFISFLYTLFYLCWKESELAEVTSDLYLTRLKHIACLLVLFPLHICGFLALVSSELS